MTQPVDNPHRRRDTLKGLWPADDSQQGKGPPVRRENQVSEILRHVSPTFFMCHPSPAWKNWDGQSVVTHSERKWRLGRGGLGVWLALSIGERKDRCLPRSLIANDPKHVLE